MGDFKKAEPSLALDVDVLILDYLLYNATSEFLEVSELCALDDNSEDALSACNEHITMVNSTCRPMSNPFEASIARI